MRLKIILGLICCLGWLPAYAAVPQTPLLNSFINTMVQKHHFAAAQIANWLQAAEIKADILKSMRSPAEAKPWYKYRQIFITDKRIQAGVMFWQQNNAALTKVSTRYGVPPEIIIAIIGVETHYGDNVGRYRVIDALATLGFAYPPRSTFFLGELEQFLLLCREEGLDPLLPIGSYAGAMGLAQFMPSSYRRFAVDFEGDARRDIWHNPADAIASVANYFAKHHWQTGGEVFIPAVAEDKRYQQALGKNLEPDLVPSALNQLGVHALTEKAVGGKVKLLAFEQEQGNDLWLGLTNYYVITRYNHSPLYALAAYQLSQAILEQKRASSGLHYQANP